MYINHIPSDVVFLLSFLKSGCESYSSLLYASVDIDHVPLDGQSISSERVECCVSDTIDERILSFSQPSRTWRRWINMPLCVYLFSSVCAFGTRWWRLWYSRTQLIHVWHPTCGSLISIDRCFSLRSLFLCSFTSSSSVGSISFLSIAGGKCQSEIFNIDEDYPSSARTSDRRKCSRILLCPCDELKTGGSTLSGWTFLCVALFIVNPYD
jgi:hypothetical protein